MARTRSRAKTTAAEPAQSAAAKAPAAKPRASAKAKNNGSPTANGKASRGARGSSSAPALVTQEQIAAKAYEIWEAKGRPLGLDLQNWQEAEAALGTQ